MAVDKIQHVSESNGSDDSPSGDGGPSEATTERLLKLFLVAVVAVVAFGAAVGLGIWFFSPEPAEPTPLNTVDVGFLQDMTDHHIQALVISEIYLADQPDGAAAPYAREVIQFQEREIGWMDDWLSEAGYEQGDPDREAMVWMGMSTSVADMPGMQSVESLDRLSAAEGAEADLLFFELMSDHHLGGIHMAEFEIANGANEDILRFAATVVRNQRIEIIEYEMAVARLGLN